MVGRPATKTIDEIEVTPEMIEAGAEALGEYDGGYYEHPQMAAERIYRVMERVRVAALVSDRQVRADIA